MIIEWGMVHLTFLSNYHHRLLMGFPKVIVINMNITGIKPALKPVITMLKQSQ